MSAAEKRDATPGDPPALVEALRLLDMGLWPVVIHPPGITIRTKDGTKVTEGKEPIGEGWGLVRPTVDSLRARFACQPSAGVGVKLGKEAYVIDVEIDDRGRGEPTLAAMLDGEVVETMGWDSRRGNHRLFRWDDRIARFDKAIIKIGGVEIRAGKAEPGGQYQSVTPPTRNVDGSPRVWNGIGTIAALPDAFFVYLDANVVVPGPSDPPSTTIPIYTPAPGQWSAVDRARAYLAKVPPAVSGQGGHDQTFKTVCNTGCGFGLTPEQFLPLLREWSSRCEPPWSEKELTHKVKDAYDREKRRGWLLGEYGEKRKTSQSSTDGGFEGSEGSEGCSQGNTSQGDKPWKVPRLFEPLPAVPFPLDVLPLSLANLCREGAAALQCPVDYWGSYVLALAGAAIGLSVNLTVKAHYHEAPNLYLAVVGPPGTKKSPPLKILARPFWEIDTDLRADFDAAKSRFEEDRREYDSLRKRPGADPGPVPTVPVRVQLTVDETTREAVALIHSENPRGLVMIRDELTAWVKSLDAYRNGKGDDMQFWLKVNTGALVKVDRKGNREQIIIPQPCITIAGGLTPGSLPTIRSGADDGWLDRILFSYPVAHEAEDWTDLVIPDESLDDWSHAVRRLWSRTMPLNDRGRPRPFLVSMTGAARNVWRDWVNGHRAETRDVDFARSLRGPWAKMEGFAARFALILSQLHQAYDPTDDAGPRDVDPMDIWGASQLADYFKAHFKRAINELSSRPELIPDDADAVIRWLRKSDRPSFSERDVKLNFQGRFAHKPLALADTLAWLVARDCIRPAVVDARVSGRPHSTIFDVNPLLLSSFASTDLLDTDSLGNGLQNLQNLQNSEHNGDPGIDSEEASSSESEY